MTFSQLTAAIASEEPEPPERSLRVLVANQTDREIDAGLIEAAVQAALARSPYASADISVAIVDDSTIHKLNVEFLQHDYPTDVLSFALADDPPRLEGEIVASFDTAERCAAEAGWSAAHELLLYIIHGALHLAGYRDKTPSDAGQMRAAETEILAQLAIPLSPIDSRWRPTEGNSP